MKKICFALIVSFLVISCKDREMRVNEFIVNYNLQAKKLRKTEVRNTKALYKDKDEVIIEFEFSFLNDSMQMHFIEKSIADIVTPMIKTVPQGKRLLKDGINFNLQLFNRNHVKFGQVNLSSNTTDIEKSPASNDIQSLIATLNKSLPVTDPESGHKLLRIELERNNLVYAYEIPDELLDIYQLSEMDEIIKEDILSNPSIKSVLNNGIVYINSIVCVYFDKNNIEFKKVTLSRQDFVRKAPTDNRKQDELVLNVVLSSINKKLPLVDDKFGFKFTEIKTGYDNSIECNYQVPDKYLDILKVEL